MKNKRTRFRVGAMALAVGLVAASADAHEIAAKKGNAKQAAFDIVKTDVRFDAAKKWAEFTMQVSGKAGAAKPKKSGKFAGSDVFSYVWPTKIDPSAVGFDKGAGILALAVTIHPDFDDTPLFNTTGADWHSHWVVLAPDDACGKGALKVKDIPEGSKPALPKTWPGVPLLIDSPGYAPLLCVVNVFDVASGDLSLPGSAD